MAGWNEPYWMMTVEDIMAQYEAAFLQPFLDYALHLLAKFGGIGPIGGGYCTECQSWSMVGGVCMRGCAPEGMAVCPAALPSPNAKQQHTASCVLCKGKGFVEELKA